MYALLISIFGEGKDLNMYQMSARGLVVYFITLVLLRISGRRTFGKKTAFDNTVTIILGAVLSRAIVGASPFLPTVVCSLLLVLIHRGLAWLALYYRWVEHLMSGESMPIYQGGKFNTRNMKHGLINEKDVMGDIRQKTQTNSLNKVTEIYLETNGEVSVLTEKS